MDHQMLQQRFAALTTAHLTDEWELVFRSPEVNVAETAQVMTEWAVKQTNLQLVHLENDTEVYRAVVRIGVIRNIKYGPAGKEVPLDR